METKMENQKNTQSVGAQTHSFSAFNIGIGMLVGLLIALIVAYFAMGDGPFKDKSNKNTLGAQQGSTDPNSSLYGATVVAPVGLPSNAAPGNEQGSGVGALMGGGKDASMANAQAASESGKVKASDANANPDQIAQLIQGDATATQPKAVSPTAANAKSKNNYVIQAGAFNDAEKAQALKDSLDSQGQNATITKKKTADGETVYRVRVGGYSSAQEAQGDNKKIKGVVLDAGN